MVTRFSKPAALVVCRLGTVPLSWAMLVTKLWSSVAGVIAVIATAVRWISVGRRSAVTTTSPTLVAPGPASAARAARGASALAALRKANALEAHSADFFILAPQNLSLMARLVTLFPP